MEKPMPKGPVPDVVVQRLPIYLRVLTHRAGAGEKVISSARLGELAGVSAAQVRKDLSYFGEFGKQGLGYEIDYLREQLARILQVGRDWHAALVGAGALGHAIVNYRMFEEWNEHVVLVFDNDPAKVGQRIGPLVVHPIEEMAQRIRGKHVEIGILAVPAENAQEVAEALVACGVRAILNYAPITLSLPSEIRVAYIDPVASLQSMTYYLR